MEKTEVNFKEFTERMLSKNVNDMTEIVKSGNTELTYLSWSNAWELVLKEDPLATWRVEYFGNDLPYTGDERVGYMVETHLTIFGVTRECYLPVMDRHNKSMRLEPYTYDTKNQKGIVVDAMTMFDVNKTIMRCLAKNVAMFGLGLYIYKGEDLPSEPLATKEQLEEFKALKIDEMNVCRHYNISSVEELTAVQAQASINAKKRAMEKSK